LILNEEKQIMHTFAEKLVNTSSLLVQSALPSRAHFEHCHAENSSLHLQRALGNQSMLHMLQLHGEDAVVGVSPKARVIQPKLTINQPGDEYEQEADRISEQVMQIPEPQLQRACACGGACSERQKEQPDDETVRVQRIHVGNADIEGATAPSIVREVLSTLGAPLDLSTRKFVEPRFGYDLSRVRIHTDAKAAESARAVKALAYTVGNDIVFGAGQYTPETYTGKRLLAHELSHVKQQRQLAAAHANNLSVVQRICDVSQKPTGNAIASQVEEDYLRAVREGKYCKDTGTTGVFHEGRCYREIPSKLGFPGGDQVCFDRKAGQCAEDSPDIVSAVWGQNADGSCKLGFARSIGHFAEDIFPSESGIVGTGLGLLAGLAIGYAADLAPYRLLGLANGLVLGTGWGTALAAGIGPLARRLSRRGYVPTLGLSAGLANPFPNLVGDATWQARLYIGAAKRERPLLNVFYPELKLGVTLIGEQDTGKSGGEKIGPSAITSLVAGIRIDPGQPGGHYLSFFGGPALSVSAGGTAVGAEAGIAFGYRWRWIGYSANVGYIREPSVGTQFTLGLGVDVGPEKPPAPEKKRLLPEGGMLSKEVVEGIRRALEKQVSPEALMPPEMRARLAEARRAADQAGPDEEPALIKARDALETEAAEYMNAHDVAFDLAVLMDKAHHSGSPFVMLEFSHYGSASVSGGDLRKSVVREIRRIVLLLRDYLPERAAGVNTILIVFRHEQAAVHETIRLPGWVTPEKGPFG
jgi:hypothetical protein